MTQYLRDSIQALSEQGPPAKWHSDPDCWIVCCDDLNDIAEAIDHGYLEVAEDRVKEFESYLYPPPLHRRNRSNAALELVLDQLWLEIESIRENECDPHDIGFTSRDFCACAGSKPTSRGVLLGRDSF